MESFWAIIFDLKRPENDNITVTETLKSYMYMA